MKDEPWMTTYSGQRFGLLGDSGLGEIRIEDIANSLGKLCRFTGHCLEFYSVAEHSVMVSYVVRNKGGTLGDQLAGLLHDAAEAYTGDVSRPWKVMMPDCWHDAEWRLERAIYDHFRVSQHNRPLVKEADNIMLAIEGRDLMANTDMWQMPEPAPKYPVVSQPLGPHLAVGLFLARYKDLELSIWNTGAMRS